MARVTALEAKVEALERTLLVHAQELTVLNDAAKQDPLSHLYRTPSLPQYTSPAQRYSAEHVAGGATMAPRTEQGVWWQQSHIAHLKTWKAFLVI